MERQLLKEISDEIFGDRYKCDRLTATVLSNRFRYIVEHMCRGLLTTAFSVILRDWYDFSATISGPPEMDYPMPAVSNSLLLFIFNMPEAVSNTVEEYGVGNLRPGDVIVANDPYRTGTHVNDCCFIRPVFRLNNELVGFVNIQAHMVDMGGTVPAGFSPTKKSIYENGLVLSGQLLYKNDQPYKPTWNLFFDNTRYGEVIIPDIKAIYQNLVLGEKLLIELINSYGLEAYFGAIKYACDVSAESMELGIEKLQDGVYEGEDLVDCDGIDDSESYKVKVKITIKNSRAEVDLSGTSRQARTSFNVTSLDCKTAVGTAFKFLLDPHGPITSASLRPIDIVLPPGTILSALPPEGVVMVNAEAPIALYLAILKALKAPLGENAIAGEVGTIAIHNANGVWPESGIPWVTMAQCGGEHGPWGATKIGDGDSYNVTALANNLDPATEAIESEYPVVILRKEYVTDTGGAGKHRGGAGVVKDSLWLQECEHYTISMHFKEISGFGVNGGNDGMSGGTWVFPPEIFNVKKKKNLIGYDSELYKKATPVAGLLNPNTNLPDRSGDYFYSFRIPMWHTKPYTIFRYITHGGGGWGNPLDRDPEKVKNDVRDEYISIEKAKDYYGVLIKGDVKNDPEGLEIDYDETNDIRRKKKMYMSNT
jgi:N-methylhydantoinase B